MRIGFVISGSLEQISGGCLYDRKLTAYLQRHGHELSVISIPSARPSTIFGRFLGQAAGALTGTAWDLLLEDELAFASLFDVNERLKAASAFPIVSLVHRLRSSERRAGRVAAAMEARYLRSVDAFVFSNAATAATVRAILGKEPLSVIACPGRDSLPAQEPRAFRPYGENNEQFIVIFVGNVIRRKGLHTLIEALSRLREIDWQLRVVGNLWIEKDYLQEIRGYIDGIAGRIRFYGMVSESRLCDLLRSSHVLAIPSSYEGMGISYLEAMGFGMPVIASSAGGAGEVITDGKEGFLVPPEDPALVALRIWQLARRPELLRTMGENARERFSRLPTWEATCSLVNGFLTRLSGLPSQNQ